MKKESKQIVQPLYHNDHRRPVTRRELMAQGFLGSSAMVFAPLLGTSFASAQEFSAGPADPTLIPYLIFDLEGGAGLPGNFLVGKQGGPKDYLSSYDKLGWDPRDADSTYDDFGLPMSRRYSKILQGMLASASAEALAKLRLGSFCHFAQDDSNNNKSSPLGAISDLGNQGTALRIPLGTRRTSSGGNSTLAYTSASLRPLAITQVGDLAAALSFGSIVSKMPLNQQKILARTIRDLTGVQVNHLAQTSNSSEIGIRSQSVYAENETLFASGIVADVDARNNPLFSSLYGISRATTPETFDAISATVVMNVLQRISGPGVITIAGCDYHTGTQSVGDDKDAEIGRQIGLAVEAAHRLQTPLFLQILTDGGVYARQGTRAWQGDAGDKCMTVIGYYNPSGPPIMRRTQVGWYTDGQGADRSSLIGAEPAKVAWAVFANYLNAMGKLGRFEDFGRGVFISTSELESTLIFG